MANGSQQNNLPPIPEGFVLESGLPPIPEGFVLESETPPKAESWPKVIGKSVMGGLTAVPRGVGAVKKGIEDVSTSLASSLFNIPEEKRQEFLKSRIDIHRPAKEAEEFWQPETGDSFSKRAVANILKAGGEMASTAAVTGGVGLLPAMATRAGAEKFVKTREEGYGLPESAIAGTGQGLLEYVTEKNPIKILRQPGLKFANRLFKGLVSDEIGEVAATLGEMDLIDRFVLGKKYTWEQRKQALIDTIVTSAGLTLGATTVSHPMVRQQQKQTQRIIDEIAKAKQPIEEEQGIKPETEMKPEPVSPEMSELPPIPEGFVLEAVKAMPQEVKAEPSPPPPPPQIISRTIIEGGKKDEGIGYRGVPPGGYHTTLENLGAEKVGATRWETIDRSNKPLIWESGEAQAIRDKVGYKTDYLAEGEVAPPELNKKLNEEIGKAGYDSIIVKGGEEIGLLNLPDNYFSTKQTYNQVRQNLSPGQHQVVMGNQAGKDIARVVFDEKGQIVNEVRPELLTQDLQDYVKRKFNIDLIAPSSEFQLEPTRMPVAKPKAPVQEDSFKGVPSAMPSTAIEAKDVGDPMLAEITQREEAKRQMGIPIEPVIVKPTKAAPKANPATDSLATYIRKQGGFDYQKEHMKGELDRLSSKEAGTTGLVRKQGGGHTLDQMLERAIEDGYFNENAAVNDLINALENEVHMKKKHYSTQKAWTDKELSEMMATAGERGSLKLPSLENIKQFGKDVKEFISPLSALPEKVREDYLTARYKAMGWIDRVDDLVSNFNKKLKGISPEHDNLLYQFLDGQIGMEKIPDNLKTTAHQMRNAQNIIGKMLVVRGKLDPNVFEGNKNKYIRHSYLRHILGDENIMSNPTIKVDASYLKQRKLTDLARQKELGILEKASEAYPISISKPLSDIGKWDFHNKIMNDPDLTWQPSMVKIKGEKRMSIGKLAEEIDLQQKIVNQAKTPEAQIRLDKLENAMNEAKAATGKLPADYVQLPMSSSYGELAGAVVKKAIARDLQPVFSGFAEKGAVSKLVNTIINIESKGMAAFKVAKTALNPPTMARNAISGFVQNNMSGIPIWEMPVWMTKTALEIKNKGKYYVQAKRNGAFKTNFGEAEIAEVLDTVKNMQNKTYPDILGGLSKLGKYYGKIDDFYKLMKFIEQREGGASIGKAIMEAQKWNMDYSLAHPAVKLARRHVVPFASYTYKIAPLIAESLAKRPWVIAKYAAIPYLMAEAAKSSLNLTDDDWEKLKKMLPLFIRQNQTVTPLPWKSPEGHVQWINLEYFFPWQQFNAIARDAYYKKYTELPSDMGIGNPFMDAYFATRTGKDIFTKQDIYNELDTPTEKALKASEFIWNKWGPGAFQRYGALGYTASIGKKDKYGRTITPAQAIGRWGGVNIIAPTPIQAAKELQFKKMELDISLNKILKDPTISTEKKKQTVKEYLERTKELTRR